MSVSRVWTSANVPPMHCGSALSTLTQAVAHGVILDFSDAAVPIAEGRLLAAPDNLPVGRSLSEGRTRYVAIVIEPDPFDPCYRRSDCGRTG